MMKVSSFAIGTLLLLAAECALATERWHTAQIRWIYPQGNGGFILVLAAESQYCTNTAVPKYYFIGNGYNGVTEEGAKKMYAAAMMAVSMGRQISIAFDDSTPDCAINRLILRDD